MQGATRNTFYPPFFLAFRLVYAPVVAVFHSAHGAPWLMAGLILLLGVGGEWMARRYRSSAGGDDARRRRSLALVVVALVFLGFAPEEGFVGLILWAGIGLAWADVLPGIGWRVDGPWGWLGILLGGVVGLAGIWGPAPWLVAGVLAWRFRNESV